jgi:hypothetical protein
MRPPRVATVSQPSWSYKQPSELLLVQQTLNPLVGAVSAVGAPGLARFSSGPFSTAPRLAQVPLSPIPQARGVFPVISGFMITPLPNRRLMSTPPPGRSPEPSSDGTRLVPVVCGEPFVAGGKRGRESPVHRRARSAHPLSPQTIGPMQAATSHREMPGLDKMMTTYNSMRTPDHPAAVHMRSLGRVLGEPLAVQICWRTPLASPSPIGSPLPIPSNINVHLPLQTARQTFWAPSSRSRRPPCRMTRGTRCGHISRRRGCARRRSIFRLHTHGHGHFSAVDFL